MSRRAFSAQVAPEAVHAGPVVEQSSVIEAWNRAVDSVKERSRPGPASPPLPGLMQGFIYRRPSELQKALETSQTAYLPVGALRWHGRELPIGADVIMLQGLCRCCIERTGGVMLPPIIVGGAREDQQGPAFGPDFRGASYQSQLSEWLKCLQGLGAKVVILLCGPLGAEGLESLRHASLERRKDDLTVVCLSLPEISAKAGVSIEPGSSSEAALVGWAGASEAGVDGADSLRALHRGRELALSLRQVVIDETRRLLHRDGR